MAEKYAKFWPGYKENLDERLKLEYGAKRTDVAARTAGSQDLMDLPGIAAAMQTAVTLYAITVSKHGSEISLLPGAYIYIAGGFRCVPQSIFRGLPGVRATRVRIGGNVEAAKMTHQVQPIYPENAKAEHIEGTIILHVVIAEDGSMQEIQYVSGPPELMRSAMDAVRQWRYRTTYLNDEPVEVDTRISVVYTLRG